MVIQVTSVDEEYFSDLVRLFEDYRCFYNQPQNLLEADNFLKERIKNQDSIIYLIFEENNAVGFVQLYPLFSSIKMKKLWLLNDLYVKENYRKKSNGKKLIEKAKELCINSNAYGVMLETEKNNDVANELYIKENFSKDDDHNYYFWLNI